MPRNDKPTLTELFKQALKDIEGGYDLLAPKFDQSRYITPSSVLNPFFDRLSQEVGTFNCGADWCCGTGAASVYLAQLCCQHFTALDLSQGMLDRCRAKVENLNLSIDCRFVKGDALQMNFEETFDVIVIFGAFGHIPREEEPTLIRNIHAALKPEGHFFFITTGRLPWWSFSLWRKRFFNFAIAIRNFFIRPPFIMYYLTFRLPEVQRHLETLGFEVMVYEDIDFSQGERRVSDLTPNHYFKMVGAKKNKKK